MTNHQTGRRRLAKRPAGISAWHLLLAVMIMWLAAKNINEVKNTLIQMAKLSAAEGPIKPGLYFDPMPWKRQRPYRDELVELAVINAAKVEDLGKILSPEEMIDSAQGAGVFRVPIWGLWGESFDIEAKWKAIPLRRFKTATSSPEEPAISETNSRDDQG